MIGYVYTLSYQNGIVFYIGHTFNTRMRINAHRAQRKGINFKFEILEEVEVNHKWHIYPYEHFWIEQMRQWGFPLENDNNNIGAIAARKAALKAAGKAIKDGLYNHERKSIGCKCFKIAGIGTHLEICILYGKDKIRVRAIIDAINARKPIPAVEYTTGE